MLVSMKEMLSDAQRHHYALPAFDISNYEMMRAVLDTCREERSPALLMVLEPDLQDKGFYVLPAMVRAASEYYDIPICLHLDHAERFSLIKEAIDSGFSSVMYDGSKLSFDENAANAAEITRYAHARGITVEAELGHVGNAMVGNEATSIRNEDPETTLTVPTDVEKFVAMTEVDALAIAIGTAHGVYLKTPTLRIDRLDEIRAVSDCPLVLHGGSGTPDEQMKTAIEHGITKINIFSDVVTALNGGLKQKLNAIENPATWPVYVFEEAKKRMRDAVRTKIRTFGSDGRV